MNHNGGAGSSTAGGHHGVGHLDAPGREDFTPADAAATPHIAAALNVIIGAAGRAAGNYVVIVDANVYDDGSATFVWKRLREPVHNLRAGEIPAPGEELRAPEQRATT